MTQLHWLEVSEYASLSLSTIGIVTAAVTQQIVYAVAPLTLTIGLNIANRERLKYLNQQEHIRAITKLDLLIDPLRQRLENFDTFTRKLSTTTEQQLEQLRNNQQYSLDVFTQRLTKIDGLTQQLSKTTAQQIQELQHNQQQKDADAFNHYLTQFDSLAEQLSTNTQKQFEPLNLRLNQLDALTQQLNRTTEQHTQQLQRYQQEYNIADIRRQLAQLDTLTQQLSASTLKQIEPLSHRLTRLEGLIQQLNRTAEHNTQELQRSQQHHNIEQLKQRLAQLEAFSQQLSTNTSNHMEELKAAIAQIQTELQVLNLSFAVDKPNSSDLQEKIINRPAIVPTPPQVQQTNSAPNNLPVVLTPESPKEEPQSSGERSPVNSSTSSNSQVVEPVHSSSNLENPPAVEPFVNPPVSNEANQRNGVHPPALANEDANSKLIVPIPPQAQQTDSTHNPPPIAVPKNSDDKTLPFVTPGSELIKPNLAFRRVLRGHTDKVMSIAFSPNGQTLASGSHDTTLKIWNLATNEPRTLKGHRESSYFGGINSVAFSPDGKTLASGGNDKTIKLWDVLTGKEICTFTGHTEKVYSIVFSPDGKILASGSKDRTIKLWSIEKYKGIYTIPGHSDEVLCVAFSADGKILASGGAANDQTIKIWYLAENKFLTLKGHSDLHGGINSVAFSPDGKTLASGSRDKTIKLWQLSNGKEIRTLLGHSDPVCSVAFSPDGKTLASGSKDKTIKLWQVETGKELLTFTVSEDPIYCVAFSPDGQTLASGNGDKTITLLPFHQ